MSQQKTGGDNIFCRREVSLFHRRTGNGLEQTTLHPNDVKGALAHNKYVNFKHGFEVNEVETAALLNSVQKHLSVDVELIFELFVKRRNLLCLNICNQIRIHGRPGNAVDS